MDGSEVGERLRAAKSPGPRIEWPSSSAFGEVTGPVFAASTTGNRSAGVQFGDPVGIYAEQIFPESCCARRGRGKLPGKSTAGGPARFQLPLAQFAGNFLNDLGTKISEHAFHDAGHVGIGGRVGGLLFNRVVTPDRGCHGSGVGLCGIAGCR